MSAATVSPKRWLLAANGDLLNVDYVMRVLVDGGKVYARLTNGPDIELRVTVGDMTNLRQQLPLNAVQP
jgi:hypothetical protein